MADPNYVERLEGVRVLLAEHQAVIAFDLEIMLRQLGCVISKITASIVETLAVLEEAQPDVVILNPVLSHGSALPVAEALLERQIPFILVRRQRHGEVAQPAWSCAPHLEWPYGSSRLGDVLRLVLAGAAL
jgi:CheY-like chemotaxis protein